MHGNELADSEAKYAALSADITYDKLLPFDLKGPIRSYVLGKWQERWASPVLANKKYKSTVLGVTLPLGIPLFILTGGLKLF